jgi:GT2 family glycosyltransferase
VAANNWLSRWNLPVTARDTSNREIDWVSGACMMIRRDAFVQVGGLDEGFFLYWEDADFCRRLKTAGWTTRWNPEPAVTHVAARSSRSVPYRALIAFHRSAFRYFVNHAGPGGRLLSPLVVALLAGRLAFAVTYRAARGVLTPRAATRL